MHVVTSTLLIIIEGILIVLLALGGVIGIALILLLIKLLRNQGSLGGKHGLLQMHAKTKFEKQEAVSSRLVKEKKKLLKLDSGNAEVAVVDAAKVVATSSIRPVVAVRFDGDLFASERKGFAQMVDEILVNRERVESVVVVVSSPGGSVSHYGQMFSEMERIRDSGLNLTVCVDTTAASGGYLMSLPAHKIVAAPYAMVGSIGVVSEFVNGYEFLKERGIEPITMTAGKYKRSVTPLGQITEEGKQHFQERLEAIHRLFIVSVKKYRDVDADQVCNGDYWTAQESVDLVGLVDELGTSQDYLFKLNQANDLIVISQKKGKLDQGLMRFSMHMLDAIMARLGLSGDRPTLKYENTKALPMPGHSRMLKKYKQIFCSLLAASFAWQKPACSEEEQENVLRTLRPGHPRLAVTNSDIERVRVAIANDPVAKSFCQKLTDRANGMLAEPLAAPRTPGQTDMLEESRHVLKRICMLAGLYRLNGDKRYFERARQDMLHVAAFASWDPDHFLDVAEMTNALALGYDWLYAALSPADRQTIKNAIVRLGLKEGIEAYAKPAWWTSARNNWNLVCNGGLAAGALAIADEEPELASRILNAVKKSVPIAMHSYSPDGGWAEGPGYWSYGTRYAVFLIADLKTALGNDCGLSASDGFAKTGFFRIYFCGPIGKYFNFADATENVERAWQMFWLSREFDLPVLAGHEMAIARDNPDIFHLLFYTDKRVTPDQAALPLNKYFKGVDAAFLRSDWQDPKAAFVGFKGGDNAFNHAHLDLGNFVFDAQGCRWALDLGPDDYQLPGYFGNERWNYYRLRTEGHNCLTVDGENQLTHAQAPIIAFGDAAERSFVVADLTAAYENKLSAARRGIALLPGNDLIVQDEFEAPRAVSVVWHFHTRAKIVVSEDGRKVTLEQLYKGAPVQLTGRILLPAGAKFTTHSAKSEPPQGQQPDVNDLTIAIPGAVGKTSFVVRFSSAPHPISDLVVPLDSWTKSPKKAGST